jgi:4'-phosphopantetheinyl transferase
VSANATSRVAAVRVDVLHVPAPDLEAALRARLGAALGIAAARVQISRECEHCGHPDHGRPRLPGNEVSFSVSHSGDRGVITFAPGVSRIGVDLERVRPRSFLDRLAARTLTPETFATWSAAPPAQQLERFLRAWTMKEAYLKATGIGIATTLSAVPEQPAGWTVRSIDAPRGCVASIAVNTVRPVIVCDGTAG